MLADRIQDVLAADVVSGGGGGGELYDLALAAQAGIADHATAASSSAGGAAQKEDGRERSATVELKEAKAEADAMRGELAAMKRTRKSEALLR